MNKTILILVNMFVDLSASLNKLIHKVNCEKCRLFGDKDKPLVLHIEEQHLADFQCLDRGGFIYPSNLLFKYYSMFIHYV